MTAAGDAGDPRFAWLTDAELRASLEGFVRRRCSPSEAADIVQTAIADALAAPTVPADRDGFRRLLFVVARRRLVDHLRRHRREVPSSLELEPAAPGVEPLASSELLQWVERELPQSEDHRTLEWMLREAEGDKLEHIAAEVSLPAPRVRQRVSRLRRRLKERWLSQLVAASVLGALVVAGTAWWLRKPAAPHIVGELPDAHRQAEALRQDALRQCEQQAFERCLRGLDQARALDPVGDARTEVVRARAAAAASTATPAPVPAPSSITSSPTATPTPPAPTSEVTPPSRKTTPPIGGSSDGPAPRGRSLSPK